MSNLDVEGLSKIVQTGDVERMFSGGGPGAPQASFGERASSATEARVSSEMAAQGLAPAPAGDSGRTFSDILRQSVNTVNEYQHQADTAIKELVAGRSKNIHETMLTIERADTSLKLMMQVRNKILDAYREIMRMQV